MGQTFTPHDRAAPPQRDPVSERDAAQRAAALAALEDHIRALVAARDGARRALTSARRNRPGQLRRHARELARLARRLAIARRDRARHLRDRGPWPLTSVTDPAQRPDDRARTRADPASRAA